MGDGFFDENGRPTKVFVKLLFQDILWDMFFKKNYDKYYSNNIAINNICYLLNVESFL